MTQSYTLYKGVIKIWQAYFYPVKYFRHRHIPGRTFGTQIKSLKHKLISHEKFRSDLKGGLKPLCKYNL